MTDELPPEWALNKAAKAAGYRDWEHYAGQYGTVAADRSVKAHARTIAQYEQPPVDEDLAGLTRVLNETHSYKEYEPHQIAACGWYPAALAQFKRELEARK